MPEEQKKLESALAQKEVPSLVQMEVISSEFLRHLEEEPLSILSLMMMHVMWCLPP